uniref:phospholipase DDHD2 isoform X1 n=1 Tax=Ciona intestinalis TaxID=7719 RepID=UPI000EF5549A|nr:phospholipase DDHD2 isoform X1 [Ciona intestinalis]|eukprot:XP_026691178.1 phospholipase DDHD2 isoform X1 [Ciona intestinalis]
MSKGNPPPTNPLFSPMNNINFGTNALFMPVQEQSSAILAPETDPAEEASFLGQSSTSYSTGGEQQPQNVATFTLFSQKNDNNGTKSADPFANLSSGANSKEPPTFTSQSVFTSEQQQPQLFVPPSASPDQSINEEFPYSTNSPLVNVTGTLTPGPSLSAPGMLPTPPPNTQSQTPNNPYARSASRNRTMFPPNPELYNPSPTPSPQFMPPQMTTPGPPPVQLTQSVSAPTQTQAPTPPLSFEKLAQSPVPPPPTAENHYQAVVPHWFYCKALTDANNIWCPFSYVDSQYLEKAALDAANGQGSDIVRTDGGRYDVSVSARERTSLYWDEPPSAVRRCTWFSKSDSDSRFIPYEESLSQNLEREYHEIVTKGLWHKQIDLGQGEMMVVHNPQLIVHFQPVVPPEHEFGAVREKQLKSKVVKRGISTTDFARLIPENECGTPDHVVFLCHGIGPVCDLRSRSVVECGETSDIGSLVMVAHGIGERHSNPSTTLVQCVDDFRSIHLSLLRSHFKQGLESKKVHRIEFLPIHWHRALHGDATGVDRNIRRLTLPSISRLRHFTNETLLDILFYSSPVYCQTIAETIGNEINSLYKLFLSRNPNFTGSVSLSGHSLGSLILFDLLCHQNSPIIPSNPTPNQPFLPSQTNTTLTEPTDSLGASFNAEATPQLSNSNSMHSLSEKAEEPLTLVQALEQLNLSNFLNKFEAEEMDMDALLMCSESDIKDIGLPMGPRKKLIGFLKDQKDKETKRKEIEAKVALESQLLQQTASTMLPNKTLDVPSTPGLEQMESFGSFLSAATNVHVDFQQFDSGTGQPAVRYPQLDFQPHSLFAMGSPIGMFLTVRGISELGEDFVFPTCPGFINIFHPFDPVAYRVEPLINPDVNMKPVLVPHYKGRKRLHLELRDSLGRMGQGLKDGIMKSLKIAIGSMQKFAESHWQKGQENINAEVEHEVEEMTHRLMKEQQDKNDNEDNASVTSDIAQLDVGLGRLNGGKRIDYVLQERPLESFNDYLFAFQSHLCYWNNEDTVLLMMREIYDSMGVKSDSQQVKPPVNTTPEIPPPPMSTISLN